MISIVIPVKFNDQDIDHCLRAILKSTIKSLEIIIVLDGWNRTFNETPKTFDLTIIEAEKKGPAYCRNLGAMKAKYDLICFIDSDVEIYENALEIALNTIAARSLDGAIGSYDDSPTSQKTVSLFRNLLHHYHHKQNDKCMGVFWGAFGLIKKDAFKKVNGFDESFSHPSIEDVELGYRLFDAGYKVSLEANILLKHRKNWTLKRMIFTDIFLRAKPWTILLKNRNKTITTKLNASLKEKATALLVALGPVLILWCCLVPQIWWPCLIYLCLFISMQKSFYVLIAKKTNPLKLPLIVLLHHTYFISAMVGFSIGSISNLYSHERV